MTIGPAQLTPCGDFVNGGVCTTLALAFTHPAKPLKNYLSTECYWMHTYKIEIKDLHLPFFPHSLSRSLAQSAAFATYNIGRQHLQDNNGVLSTNSNLAISCFAAIPGAPLNASCEQLMIRKQLYGRRLTDHFKTIYLTEGICKGVFKGSVATAGRDISLNLGVRAFNDIAKEKLQPVVPNPFVHEVCSGLSSGAVAAFLMHPFDIIKTRMHQAGFESNNFRTTAKIIFHQEGIHGLLFRNLAPRTIAMSPLVCAITMLKERIPYFLSDRQV